MMSHTILFKHSNYLSGSLCGTLHSGITDYTYSFIKKCKKIWKKYLTLSMFHVNILSIYHYLTYNVDRKVMERRSSIILSLEYIWTHVFSGNVYHYQHTIVDINIRRSGFYSIVI